MKSRLLSWLGAGLIRLIGITVRVTIDDPHGFTPRHQTRGPMLFAFWHNRLFLMPYLYKKYQPGRQLAALISASRDGGIIAEIIDRFGLRSVRGSTSRKGTEAMLSMIRLVKEEGIDIGVTPDGPRGPRYVVQPGILQLSQATGCPIIPVAYHLQWKIELPSWDLFQVPVPFTRCEIRIGAPLHIPLQATPEVIADWSRKLAVRLDGQ
jgi:lysophospholipid acyltransferase (LPLAT)-like uncharacterized protein